jgi:hypothetical protein
MSAFTYDAALDTTFIAGNIVNYFKVAALNCKPHWIRNKPLRPTTWKPLPRSDTLQTGERRNLGGICSATLFFFLQGRRQSGGLLIDSLHRTIGPGYLGDHEEDKKDLCGSQIWYIPSVKTSNDLLWITTYSWCTASVSAGYLLPCTTSFDSWHLVNSLLNSLSLQLCGVQVRN